MIKKIDFSKFEPYNGKESKSFEVFCYHICIREYGHLGNFTSIDGSGGDGGIEFYLELKNGDLWGWQCKYFGDTGRLAIGGRKNQIKNSFLKSKLNDKLVKWILCLKNDLTPEEILWFKSEIKENSLNINSSWWGDTHLTTFLSEPKFNGIANFFFGALEISKKWFEEKFNENYEKVKLKYDPDLHVIDEFANNIIQKQLLSNYFYNQVEDFKNKYIAELDLLVQSIMNYRAKNYLNESDLKFISEIENNSIDKITTYRKEVILIFENWVKLLKNGKLQSANETKLNEIIFKYYEIRDQIKIYPKDTNYSLFELIDKINKHFETFEDLHPIIENEFNYPNSNNLHVFAKPGFGKTNLSCFIALGQIENELPIIYLPASRFSSYNSIEIAIKNLLDLPNDINFEIFLELLDTIGNIKKCKIPILIDGLNETRDANYAFSNIWENHLPSFLNKISKYPNIILITTCRKSYKEKIGSNVFNQFNILELEGFEDPSIAVRKYFKKYKLQITNFSFPALNFKNPLYLKIFCESYGSINNGFVYIDYYHSLFINSYSKYFENLNKNLIKENGFLKGQNILVPQLKKLGNYLWHNNARAIPVDDFYELTVLNGKPIGEILINEELLFINDFQDGKEVVEFNYQLLSGYIIALELLESNKENINELLKSPYFQKKLFSDNFNTLHPLYEDINWFISLLLPLKYDVDLSSIIETEEAERLSLNAVFTLPNEVLNSKRLNYISDSFENIKLRNIVIDQLYKTFDIPNYNLNIDFGNNLLSKLTIIERDLFWTQFVNFNSFSILRYIENIEKHCNNSDNIYRGSFEKSLELGSKLMMWILTSTFVTLRDKATKALYNYSLIFPKAFAELVLKSITINDPYIQERMLGVLYGLCLAKRYKRNENNFFDEILPSIARTIYEYMFSDIAEFSTTHIIIRDYASRILKISILYCPNLFSIDEIENFEKPFIKGGIRNWGESEPIENSFIGPIHMDFDNYQIGYIVPNGSSYSNPPEKQQVRRQIYWRIYDLGYKEEIFHEIDTNNRSSLQRRGEKEKIERFGKKYSWIAYHEIAGYRHDLGLLFDEDLDSEKYLEPRKILDTLDITFPEITNEFKHIANDQLGRENLDLFEWIKNGGNAPINYDELVSSNLKALDDSWVCLDGFNEDTDNHLNRSRFTFIRGFFVGENEYDDTINHMKKQNNGARVLPDPINDYNLMLGEIGIWKEGGIISSEVEIDFKIGEKTVKIGKEDPLYYMLLDNKYKFTKTGISITAKEPKSKFIKSKKDIVVKKKVIIPVIKYLFSGGDSSIVAPTCTIPNYEIIKFFDLIVKPKTFNFYDRKNELASFSISGDFNTESTSQRFTFLRKDLFDKFLEEKKLKFAWVLWGERDIGKQNSNNNYINFQETYNYEPRQLFSEIIDYKFERKN